MKDLSTPLPIKQLTNEAKGDFGLGEVDAVKMETYLLRAYTIGLNRAEEIFDEIHDKRFTNPGSD